MKRICIAALAGGVGLYIWGLVSWFVLPWHEMEAMPKQEAVVQALRDSGAGSGVYKLPMVDAADLTDAQKKTAQDAWKEEHKQGPVALIVYQAGGSSPVPVMAMITGLILNILMAGIAASMLHMAAPAFSSLVSRLLFVLLIGVYLSVGGSLMNWNYGNSPFGFTVEMIGDTLVGALVMAIPLALIVRPGGGASSDTSGEIAAG